MNQYLLLARNWYEDRSTRERLLVLLISFVLLYAIFDLFIFNSLEQKIVTAKTDIQVLSSTANGWNKQIASLAKIAESPLYKKWQQQRAAMNKIRSKYQYQLQQGSSIEWQEIVKTILQSQRNMTLLQIKNFPEIRFADANLPASEIPLYEQKLLVVVYGNYIDTVNYIRNLEKILPTIHWSSLRYEVVQYPNAKIELEFSIFYEKS